MTVYSGFPSPVKPFLLPTCDILHTSSPFVNPFSQIFPEFSSGFPQFRSHLSVLHIFILLKNFLMLFIRKIMTTGSAGGMAKPYKGMLPASAGTRPEYD